MSNDTTTNVPLVRPFFSSADSGGNPLDAYHSARKWMQSFSSDFGAKTQDEKNSPVNQQDDHNSAFNREKFFTSRFSGAFGRQTQPQESVDESTSPTQSGAEVPSGSAKPQQGKFITEEQLNAALKGAMAANAQPNSATPQVATAPQQERQMFTQEQVNTAIQNAMAANAQQAPAGQYPPGQYPSSYGQQPPYPYGPYEQPPMNPFEAPMQAVQDALVSAQNMTQKFKQPQNGFSNGIPCGGGNLY